MPVRAATFNSASIDDFRNWLSLRGMADNTLRAYSSDLRLFLKESGAESLDPEEYEDLAMAWLQMGRSRSEPVAPRTTQRRLTSLRKFAKAMFGESMLEDYSPPTAAPGAPHPIPEGLDGVQRMIDVARRTQHQAIMALCGFAGLRVAESLSITPGSFNLDNMSLKVRGKGDKTRHVPVSERAWEVLCTPVTRAFAYGGYDSVLVPMHERGARKAITTAGERAHLRRRVASHDLRATFATALWDATGDMILVQRTLGHANFNTTQGYIGSDWSRMADAVNRL